MTVLPPARIGPLPPPYVAEVEALLTRMTPPGAPEPLCLLRTLAHHPEMADRMRPWAGFAQAELKAMTAVRVPLEPRQARFDQLPAL